MTDISNAARTDWMDISTGQWHAETMAHFGATAKMLPEIRSNAEVYGCGCVRSNARQLNAEAMLKAGGNDTGCTHGAGSDYKGRSDFGGSGMNMISCTASEPEWDWHVGPGMTAGEDAVMWLKCFGAGM